jgi:hypothetical protein
MARLKKTVETPAALPAENPSPSLQEKIDATVDYMRKAGMSEEDIEAFKKEQAA